MTKRRTGLVCFFAAASAAAVAWAVELPGGPPGDAVADAEQQAASEIRAVLDRQLARWNAGDLDGFLEDYWRSPRLTFSSGGQTRRGYQQTRERYLAAYPDAAAMGETEFSELEVTVLGDTAAMVLGRWALKRPKDDGRGEEAIGGNFTLVFRKIGGRWLIIHDHTSRSPPPAQ
ncbi:MAG: SgcJ/EcaC family oxidoreductase [Planctomycetota bacterium]